MKRTLLFTMYFSLFFIAHAQNWTWVNGDQTGYNGGSLGVYGNIGSSQAVPNNPGGRTNAATWVDASGNLWMFGGFGYKPGDFTYSSSQIVLNDLWKFNKATNKWTWVAGTNQGANTAPFYSPLGSYASYAYPGGRQNATTWVDASGIFWLFGGNNGAYLNDLWKYNPATGQWAWVKGNNTYNPVGNYGTQGIEASTNVPGGRGTSSSSWIDATGNFWIFGGYGETTTTSLGYLNDVWKYNPTTNNWTWMKGSNTLDPVAVYGTQGVETTTNTPSASIKPAIWQDATGNVFMFGGGGVVFRNDVWKYNPSSNNWTWIKGNPVSSGISFSQGTLGVEASTNLPDARNNASFWKDNAGIFWLYGGKSNGGYAADLWKYNPATNNFTWTKGANEAVNLSGTIGIYGTITVETATNTPGDKCNSAFWKDADGKLWILGGYGFGKNTAMGVDILNDLWQYDITTNNWTWKKGSDSVRAVGFYGTQGVANDAPTTPGGRHSAVTWKDAAGTFWLFGGIVTKADGAITTDYYLNDLWKYDKTTNLWTWVKGSAYLNYQTTSVTGTQGIAAANNIPSCRFGSATWVDGSGKLWLYSGWGANAAYNDLWKYDPITNNWTWMKGSTTVPTTTGSYGTQGVTTATNTPGGRVNSITWVDNSGNFWMHGGLGNAPLSDLWKYDPTTNNWTWINGTNTTTEDPVYGTRGVAASTNSPGRRFRHSGWKDAAGNLWLFGGHVSNNYTVLNPFYNDLWKYDISTNMWTWMKGSSTFANDGVYGTQGVEAAANTPSARYSSLTWADNNNNLWLFGGYSNSSNSSVLGTNVNDLWKYNIATGNWTWVKGNNTLASTANFPVWGTQGIADVSNTPGGKRMAAAWYEGGNLWLFGGTTSASVLNNRNFNDLWKFNTNAAVPLNFLSFTLQNCSNQVCLNWSVTNEKNNIGFEIERSSNGVNFTQIGFVSSQNKTIAYYSFSDLITKSGEYFYRLKQKDIDGKFSYSSIQMINFNKNSVIKIYPNPASSFIIIEGLKNECDIIVQDITGKIVKRFMPATNHTYSLSGINKGLYFIQVKDSFGERVEKLLIQ